MIKFRGHDLVIGATGAGKGVFSAMMAAQWMRAGMKVFLLCNKQDEYEDFPANFKTMQQDRLLEEVKKLKAPEKGYVDTLVVIDEAWQWDWKNRNNGLQMIPNAARAFGVEMLVQSQFPTQMVPTVRANCQNIFCFVLQEPAALDWAARSYGDTFRSAGELMPGQYIAKRGLETPYMGTAWCFDRDGNFIKAR